MKAEFQKIIKLFEELEEAGETAFLLSTFNYDYCSNLATSFWSASPPSWRKSKGSPQPAGSCPPNLPG